MQNKKTMMLIYASGYVAMTTALHFLFVLPVQTYLANSEMFPYSIGAVLLSCGVDFCIGTIAIIGVLWVTSRFIGLRLHLLLLAFVVVAIVEAGPLSIGLPLLDGNTEGYRSLTRALADAGILFLILLVPQLFYRSIRNYIVWSAVAIAVYSGATLFDVRKAPASQATQDELLSPQVQRQDVVENALFSDKKNVIVIILDAVSTGVAADVFAEDQKLASRFPGFVNYVDNLGMQWTTAVAIPALFSGKYFERTCDLPEYSRLPFTAESFAADYLAAGAAVFINAGPYAKGFSNRMHGTWHDGRKWNVRVMPMHGEYSWTLHGMSLFRAAPYFWKGRMLSADGASDQTYARDVKHAVQWKCSDDREVFSRLKRRPVANDEKMTLHVHHVKGGHRPITYDANGAKVVCDDPTYADYKAQCTYVFKLVADLFDTWKTNGVYDSSCIVLLGDHGEHFSSPDAELKGIPQQAFPFLMVKHQGGDAPYEESTVSTSHARIAELVRMARSRNLNRAEIEDVIRQDVRMCQFASEGKIRRWTIGADGTVSKKDVEDAEPDVGTMRPLQIGMKYNFAMTSAEPYPDFVSAGGTRSATSGLAMSGRSDLDVRVRVEAGVYDVRLRVGMKNGKTENGVLVSAGTTEERVDCVPGQYQTSMFVLRAFVPDKDGIISLKVRQVHPGRSYVVLNTLQVDKHADKGECPAVDGGKIGEVENSSDCVLPNRSKPLHFKLENTLERATLHMSGCLTAEGQTNLNIRAGIVLVRAFDQHGSELTVANLPYSKGFKCGYTYLPVGTTKTPFSFDVQLPVTAKRVDLSVARFSSDKKIVLSDFEYRVEMGKVKLRD